MGIVLDNHCMGRREDLTSNVSPSLQLRAVGPLACFTRPELKVERMSYPVMTPSAARGLLEAVLWKPGLAWHVRCIRVLKPIRFISFRRNEVSHRATAPSAALVAEGGPAPVLFADDDRAQRNTVALRDVDYVVEAFMSLTPRAGPEDNMTKFVDMFQRRVAKGQHFHQPYFGCREFAAEVLPADDSPSPVQEDRDLGLMLWDIDYSAKPFNPLFFRARLRSGVLEVPDRPEPGLEETSTEGAPS